MNNGKATNETREDSRNDWLDEKLKKCIPFDPNNPKKKYDGWMCDAWRVVRGKDSDGTEHQIDLIHREDIEDSHTLSLVYTNSVDDFDGPYGEEQFTGTYYEVHAVIMSIRAAQKLILEEIGSGDLPTTIKSFSDLHAHCDANEYLDLDGHLISQNLCPALIEDSLSDQHDRAESATNAVVEAIHLWLSTGAAKDTTEYQFQWLSERLDRDFGGNWSVAAWCVSCSTLKDPTGGEHIDSVYVTDNESWPATFSLVRYEWSFTSLDEDPETITSLFVGTFKQVQHIVQSILRGKNEIRQDIANGTVPANVDCFGDLDDHTDPAMYGGRGDDGWFAALGQSCVDAGVMGSDADPSDACDPEQCKGGIHDSVYGWGIHADAANALETALSTWLHARA